MACRLGWPERGRAQGTGSGFLLPLAECGKDGHHLSGPQLDQEGIQANVETPWVYPKAEPAMWQGAHIPEGGTGGGAALALSPLLRVPLLQLPSSCSLTLPPPPFLTPSLAPPATHCLTHILSTSWMHLGLAIRELTRKGGACSPRLVRPWEMGEPSEGRRRLPGREGTRIYLAEAEGGGSGRWREAPWLPRPSLSCPGRGIPEVPGTGLGQEEAEGGHLSSSPRTRPEGICAPTCPCQLPPFLGD